MIVEIRKERGGHCAFVSCKRVGYVVLTDLDCAVTLRTSRVGFYRECKKHFTETVDMRDWSDNAKAQFKQLNGVSHV